MAGATIKIGANSTEFQKQMREVSKQLKLVSSECGVAGQKAKLFGTTQDQLAVKHKELTAKLQAQNQMMKLHQERIKGINVDIEKQKSKQSELNTKIEEATKKYKDSVAQTGKNSEESKKLKKELEGLKEEYAKNDRAIESNNNKLTDATIKMNNTEKAMLQNLRALNDVNKEIANAKLDKLAEGFDKVSNATGKASDKLKPVSTAIVGIGTASAAASITFEDSMAKVSTIADDTVVSYDDMKKAILELSDQTGISANLIADDVYNAISAGQSTADAVNFVQESTKLAKAGFAESGQALDLLTTTLNAYGLEAEKVGEVSDTFIQIQNKGKTTVGDLSSTMGKIIPTANSMGVALDQLGAGYALMTSKGIATAETTTYMNSLLNELGKSGTKASDALKKGTGKTFQQLTKDGVPLGNVLATLEKEAKKNGKSLADMFGSAEAGKAALVLAGEEGKAFSNMLKEMQGSAGATDTAFEKVNDTTGNKLKQALNQVKNTGISMGDALAPVIGMIANCFSSLAGVLSSLDQTQLQFIAGIGIGIVALNGALSGISKLTSGISNGIKAFKDIKENTSKAVESIKSFGTNAMNTAKKAGTFAKSVGSTMVNAVKGGAKALGGLITNLGKAALGFTKSAIQAGISATKFILHKGASIASAVATNGLALAQAALNFVMSLNPITLIVIAIGALVAAIVVLWNKCDWFRNLVMAMFEGLKMAWNATIEFFKNIWNGFVSVWQMAVEGFKNIWNSVCNFFKVIWQGVCNYFQTVWNFWKSVFDNVVNGIKFVWDGACNIFKSVWQGVCNVFSNLFTGFKNTFTNIVNGIKSIWNTVCNFFKSAWNGACNGIKSVFTGVKNTVVGIAQSMTNTVIRAINWCIRQLNKIKFSVPDWVPLIGGKSWGVNIAQISEVSWLYKGGIIDRPTVLPGGIGVGDAYKGRGRQAEAIIPLESMYKNIKGIVTDVVKNTNANSNEKGLVLSIENFYNEREIDIDQLVKELEFYRKKYR